VKSKKWKVILCLTTAMLILMTFVTGCNGGSSTNGSESVTTAPDSTTQGTTASEDLPVIKVKFFKVTDITTIPKKGNSPILTELENRFKMEFEMSSSPTYDKLTVMLMSGETPDVFNPNVTDSKFSSAEAAITREELETFTPNLYKYYKSFAEEKLGSTFESVMKKYEVAGGKYVGLPWVWEGGAEPRPLLWRKDILDELGKTEPETLGQVEDIFSAFKQRYPEKYCMTGCGKDLLWQTFTHFLGGSGVNIDQWNYMNAEGKIVYGMTKPEVREVLGMLARWYSAGYIDPKFMEKTEADRNNEFISGDTIVLEWYGAENPEPPFDPSSFLGRVVASVPQATFTYSTIPVLRPGIIAHGYVWNPFHGQMTAFGRQLENDPDKLHRLLQLQDALSSDEELYFLSYYGPQGDTWKVGDNGLVDISLSTSEQRLALGCKYFLGPVTTFNEYRTQTKYKFNSQKQHDFYNSIMTGLLSPDKVSWTATPVNGPVLDDDGNNLTEKYKLTKQNEILGLAIDIILGKKPIEAWDAWLDNWKQKGGDELTRFVNERYLQYVK